MEALSPQQQKFIKALANGLSVKDAAKKAGVTEQTAHNWKKKSEIQNAITEAIAATRRGQIRVLESVAASVPKSEAALKLLRGGERAIEVLIEILESPDVRLRDKLDAAKELIRISGVVELQKAFVEASKPKSESKKAGLSDETAAQIRSKVLGISTDVG